MPNTNFGTDTFLKIKNAAADVSSDYDRKAYIRFDLSSVDPVPVAAASLTLHGIAGEGIQSSVAGQTINFSVYGLNDLDAGENWGETNITWNNAPQNDTASGDGLLGNTTLLGTFSLFETGIGSTINFGGANLATFINQDTNNLLTLIITRNFFDPNSGGYVHRFGSSEGNGLEAPSLLLTTVPEPTAGLIVSTISLCATICYRRRTSNRTAIHL